MKFTRNALALTLSGVLLAAAQQAAPAFAAQKDAAAAPARSYKISKEARQPLADLQAAVTAKDTANIPAKIAAAQAVVKTADDRYVLAQLQVQAALASKDDAALAAGLEAMIASGSIPAAELPKFRRNLAQAYYRTKQYDRAATAAEQLVASNPNDIDSVVLLSEIRNSQGRPADALALLQQGIDRRKASGQAVPEEWYKVAVSRAFKAKLPAAIPLSRDWAASYPSPTAWRDSLKIYETLHGNQSNLDLYRLARTAGALTSDNDYYRYANAALAKGLPGEAKSVLDEGFAAKKIDKSQDVFRQVYANATSKAAADRPTLASAEKSALAAAAAKPATVTGDAYLSYGDDAKAAALYRAALGKSGADSNLLNLRLGIALARQGDQAGAKAAFDKVSGPNAEIAKYWLAYLSKRA